MEGGARGGRAINKEHGHLYVRWAKKKQVPDRVCAGLEGGQGLGACRYLAEPQMLETERERNLNPGELPFGRSQHPVSKRTCLSQSSRTTDVRDSGI